MTQDDFILYAKPYLHVLALVKPERDKNNRVAPVRLRDGFVARRLGSATTKRSGDSNEIEPVILVGY
jgi:hypothetical protein